MRALKDNLAACLRLAHEVNLAGDDEVHCLWSVTAIEHASSLRNVNHAHSAARSLGQCRKQRRCLLQSEPAYKLSHPRLPAW